MDLVVEYLPFAGGSPEPVGRLYQNPRGTVFFEYETAWRATRRQLSPWYLPNVTSGAVSTPTPQAGELFGLFQDVLPDWWGEQMMRRRFGALGIPWGKVTALRKLACQGNRKMGALVFHPMMDEADFTDGLHIELESLVTAAREAMTGEPGEVLSQLVRSGMSPGGARPKALVSCPPDFSRLRVEETEGFDSWLLKFDIEPELHEGRVEAAFAAMAKAAGIDVPETRLLEAAGGCHFFTRRFDRLPSGERLHLHTFSGLVHVPLRDGLEYGDLMNVTRELTGDHRAVEEVFRRAVFNVAAGNDDDHGRNHAFLMDAAGNWSLAPAYDLTLATWPLASGFRAGRVLGKAAEIRRADLVKLAESQGVRRVRELIDQVTAATGDWERHAREAGIPKVYASLLKQQMPGLS